MKSPVLSILFLLISVTLLAVPNDFRFRHFSVEDGLSSNSVRAHYARQIWFSMDRNRRRSEPI